MTAYKDKAKRRVDANFCHFETYKHRLVTGHNIQTQEQSEFKVLHLNYSYA